MIVAGIFFIVCFVCFSARMVVFSYQGAINDYLPRTWRYIFGYIVAEVPISMVLIYVMKNPSRGYRSRLVGSVSEPRTASQLEIGDSSLHDANNFIPPRVRAMYDSKYESQVELVLSFTFASWQKICPYMEMSTLGSDNPENKLLDRTEILLQPVSKGAFTRTLLLRDYSPDRPFILEMFNVEINAEEKKKLVGSVSLTVAELVDKPKTCELVPNFRKTTSSSPRSGVYITCSVHKAVAKDTKNNEVIKGYVFKDTTGSELFVREYISESPFTFAVPYQVLRFVLLGRRKGLNELQERYAKFVGELGQTTTSPNLEIDNIDSALERPISEYTKRQKAIDIKRKTPIGSPFNDEIENVLDDMIDSRHLQVVVNWFNEIVEKTKVHVDLLESSLQLYTDYDNSYKNLSFKPSTMKDDKALAFIATNLHVHELRVPISEPLQKEQVYDLVTFGAPSAHIYKFGQGMRQIRAKRNNLLHEMGKKKEKNNEYSSEILSRKLEALDLEYDVAICQAVSAVATSLALKARNFCLFSSPKDCQNWFMQIMSIGFLFQAESLLSTYGAESGMLGDMEVAINSLKNFSFKFIDASEGSSLSLSLVPPSTNKQQCNLKYPIILPIPHEVFIRLPAIEGLRDHYFSIHPVLFSQGINEQQTLSIAVGTTTMQEEINREGYPTIQIISSYISSEILNELKAEISLVGDIIISSKREKNIEILARTSDFCRAIGGGRSTSCKSAKDRTSMSVTWEEARILARFHGLEAAKIPEVVEILRSAGVRRENCVKNIGMDKYAFTEIQMWFIPKLYRAPKGTGGGHAN